MDEGAVACRGLTRRFPTGTAVDSLDLAISRGEVLALLGPNGAGKTTTVRLLNGVLRPDEGKARVLGLDPWRDGEALRRRTGVLTEQAGLDERFTALENLEFVAGVRGMRRSEGRRRGLELLERLGMADRAHVVVQGFSTGQRKRVALARALLHEPELLFLDEPTSGLDPTATKDVEGLISGLATERGATIVLCTHFLGEAGRVADRMAVMLHGRLQAIGTPAEIGEQLWSTRQAQLDLGGPADAAALEAIGAVPGADQVTATAEGAGFEITDRETMPAVIATVVAAGRSVYGAAVHEPTLEDVYFAIEARALAEAPAPEAAR